MAHFLSHEIANWQSGADEARRKLADPTAALCGTYVNRTALLPANWLRQRWRGALALEDLQQWLGKVDQRGCWLIFPITRFHWMIRRR